MNLAVIVTLKELRKEKLGEGDFTNFTCFVLSEFFTCITFTLKLERKLFALGARSGKLYSH